MRDLRQSTAATITIGPLTDSAGDPLTSLTIQKADLRLKKNGGDAAAASADQGASDAGAPHDELGAYDGSVNTTDTNTLGHLRVIVRESGQIVAWEDFNVLPAQVWDSLYSTDLLQVDVTQWLGTAPLSLSSQLVQVADSAGVTTLLSRITSTLFSGITQLSHWLGAIAGKQAANATAQTEIRASGAGSGTYDATTDSQEAIRDNMGTAQTGDSYARLGAPAGASVSADVAAVKTDTGNLVTRITATLFSGITQLSHWLGALAGKQAANATAQTEIRASGAGSGTYDPTTDSLEAIRDAGASLTDFGIMNSTTIASLASQTSFTLSAGSADDNAYNGRIAVVTDASTAVQKAVVKILDYAGSTKTITLAEDPAIFTMAAGDSIVITSSPYSSGGSGATAAEVRAEMDSNSTQLAKLGTPAGASLSADLLTLINRLTSTRAGYLDNLSAGAVALNADIATILTRLSSARAGYLDNLSAGAVAQNADITTLLSRLSSARAGYLDNINNAALATLANQTGDAYAALTGNRADPSALGAALASSLSTLSKIDWITAAILRAGSFNKTTGVQLIKNAAGTDIAKATAADDGTTTSRGAYGAP